MTCCVDKVMYMYMCVFITSNNTGDVESTMPTKLLMEVAEYVDTHSVELKDWFLNNKEEALIMLADKDRINLDSSDVPSHE